VFDCQFGNYGFYLVGNFYSCNSNTTGTGSTLEIRGKHGFGKNNFDVEGLLIHDQPFNEILKGLLLETYFPNLKTITISRSNLSSISSNDLQYPKLLYFKVYTNKLTTIDGNLFENNPNLVYIDFDENQIQHVGYDLLTGLNDLKEIDFRNNPCINKRARNQTEIQELNRQLPLSCSSLVTDSTTTTARTTPMTTIHQSTTTAITTISTTPTYEFSCSVNCIDSNIMTKLNAREKRLAQIEIIHDSRMN
jgi:hypothetical protein